MALRAPVLALLLIATPLGAQRPDEVRPGAVVTVIAEVPAEPGDSLRFSLDPAPGIRVFGAPDGMAVVGPASAGRIAFTVGLPASAAAGDFRVGTVEVRTPGGATRRIDLAVRVRAHRDASFWVGADTLNTSPAAPLEFGYRLRNRGNAPDSFAVEVQTPPGWSREVEPARVALAPGDTAMGTVRVAPPATAVPGGEHRIRVRLAGTGVDRSATVTVAVVADDSWLGGLARIPGTLFLGSSSGPAGPGLSVRAAGPLRAGTRLSLVLRHAESIAPPTAFRGELSGPRARLDLRGPSWHLGAGDVFLASDAFVGPMQHGRGAELSVEHQEVEGRVLVATPSSYGPLQVDGHLVRAAGALETPYGRVGIRFSAVDRRTDLFEDHAAVGGGLTWDLRRAGHRLDAEAGFVRVRSDSAARAGLAGGARYRVEWAGGAVTARVRTTPGTTRGATSYGREAFLSAMVGLAPSVAVTGWGFLTAAPLVSGAPYPTSRGGAGGLRLDLPVGGTADLGAGVRRADEVGDTLGPDLTRFVQAGIDLPLGPARLEADLDVGRVTGENDRRYGNLRTGVRWHARRQWAWVGISRYDDGLGRPLSLLEVSGAVDLKATRLQAGVTLPVAGGVGQRPSLWSGAEIPLSGDYDLLTGIDYGGIAVDRARVSLGVRRRIGLPLPLPRTPVLEGTVFDDRNGDGRRGPEEPPLAGVELRLGALRATSDEDGRFRFYESGGGPLRIPASGLPRGALVPADVHLPSTGTVDVPVIRTATLEVEAFLDRDGDRVMDEAEDRAGGVLVSVVDDRRRTRDAVADADGRVRFGSLRPGRYTVRIHRGRSGAPPFETTVTIEPGSRVRLVIAVPLRGREIRLPGGASLERSTRP